jgi:hypothetical protein
MLTVVVGQMGTDFHRPVDAVYLDEHMDVGDMQAHHVCFTQHKHVLSCVNHYILDRLFQRKQTTVFVWEEELCFLEDVLPHAKVVRQTDTCTMRKCLRYATNSFMRRDGVWFPFCHDCCLKVKARENLGVKLFAL